MILAINVGNTHTVFGCIRDGEITEPVMRMKTDRNQTEFSYAAQMKNILELSKIDLYEFEGAVISSVVPPLTDIMKKAVKLLIGFNALVVGAGVKSGLHIMIDDPGTVASDLVATAVAAKEEYELPCIILDMGTATTLTLVDEKGRYVGGAIMPGIGVSLNALSEGASLLPRIDITAPKKAIASSTVESMRSGVVFGYAGAIDGIIEKFKNELGGAPATIVSTGGTADLITPYCKNNVISDKYLLLKGLGIIYTKNKK